jgi:hypothetical protein
MSFKRLMKLGVLAGVMTVGSVQAAEPVPFDDPQVAVTVMQFSVKDRAKLPELKKGMQAIRDYLRTKPGLIDNALMENRNSGASPEYVGVSRWRSFKDWENLWLDQELQKLVANVGQFGTVNSGTFSAVE